MREYEVLPSIGWPTASLSSATFFLGKRWPRDSCWTVRVYRF